MNAYGYISRIRNRCLWLHDVDRQILSDIYVWACWCTLCGNDVAWPRPVQLICTWTRWSYACSGYIIYVSWQHVYAAWNTGMMRVLGNMLYHQRIFIVSDKIAPDRVQVCMHGACMNLANRQWGYSTILAGPDEHRSSRHVPNYSFGVGSKVQARDQNADKRQKRVMICKSASLRLDYS